MAEGSPEATALLQGDVTRLQAQLLELQQASQSQDAEIERLR